MLWDTYIPQKVKGKIGMYAGNQSACALPPSLRFCASQPRRSLRAAPVHAGISVGPNLEEKRTEKTVKQGVTRGLVFFRSPEVVAFGHLGKDCHLGGESSSPASRKPQSCFKQQSSQLIDGPKAAHHQVVTRLFQFHHC